MPDDELPPETPDIPEEQPLNPEQQLAAFLRNFFAAEILPQFQQTLESRLTEIRSWVSQQIIPLTPPTPQTVAQQVEDILGPQINQAMRSGIEQMQGIARGLADRVAVLEGRPAPALVTPIHTPGSTAVAAQTPEVPQAGGGVMTLAAILETCVDLVAQKILPAWGQVQQMSQAKRLFNMDPAAIEAFRKANPIAAMMLGQQFAPDQNMMGLLNQLPFITANAIGVGMKARVMAPQLIGPTSLTGGGAWPGTLGPGSPGFSPNPPGGPSPAPTGPATGASMQNRRPRPSRNGRTGRPVFRNSPTNGAKPAAPVKLTDLLK